MSACAGDAVRRVAELKCGLQVVVEMKYRSIDHGPGVSLAAVAILIVLSAAALKYLGS
jgi:hypothetical protein